MTEPVKEATTDPPDLALMFLDEVTREAHRASARTLYPVATQLWRRVYELSKHHKGTNDRGTLQAISHVAKNYRYSEDYQEALKAGEEALMLFRVCDKINQNIFYFYSLKKLSHGVVYPNYLVF